MLTPNDALDAIAHGATADEVEHQRLDFKAQGRSRTDTMDDLAEAAACFANASGGTLVVGVADKTRGPDAFVGTDLEPGIVRRRIFEKTQPNLDVVVRTLTYSGKPLLAIDVQEGLDVYVANGKAPKRRFETSCLPLSGIDLMRLSDERRGTDWSAAPSASSTDDIDPTALLHLRTLLGRSRNAPAESPTASTAGLLSMLNLADANGALTRAGELLLCSPSATHAHEVLVYQYRETPGGEVRSGRRWQAPLLTAINEVLAMIDARVGTIPLNLSNGQQIQIEDYPLVAIREALANALTHGDLRERRPVTVEHSPQSLTIVSPGPLVAGITPENILTHPPRPRFPSLAAAMRAVGLAEQYGLGVDRMFKEMIRSGRAVPVLTVSKGDSQETTVRFVGGPPNSRVVKFVASLPSIEQDDTDALLIVSTLVSRRVVNAEQLAPIVQRDPDAAQATLLRLSQGVAQVIEPTQRSSARRYPDYRLSAASVAALGPALAYQSKPKGDVDRKVIAHVRDYGSINNDAVKRMFDVDVYAARDILKDLVQRGVLARTSEQTRGTAVRYGGGRKFPAKARATNVARATDEGTPLFDFDPTAE
ncbi:RNA-binding domain-containing protein [Microbacterium sp. A196]|uniref:RNA-binding domain-containing protein n=1 Tax=Microbacterium sp. A196 TaxID=3457320 RepID=UPI003FD223BD